MTRPVTLVAVLELSALLGWGCDRGGVTGPTSPSVPHSSEVAKTGGSVTAELRDSFLYEHNARFFRGQTFRWVPPIRIHVLTGEPDLDEFILKQFLAWEAVLTGTFATPLYDAQPIATSIPPSGIFLAVFPLPGNLVGLGNPITPIGEKPRRGVTVAETLRLRIPLTTALRRVEVPEIQANGQIQRCVIVFDPVLEFLGDDVFEAVFRHEIGHCLGFIGHVPKGLMAATVEVGKKPSLAITSDVRNMMRKLYRLPPGTKVTR
jgi:hypothetical protein